MNYIIEEDIDFFAELNKIYLNSSENNNNNSNSENNICLLSHLPLDKNHITLPCNHSFNYIDLYNEIILKKKKYNSYDYENLLEYQIKCPYCRVIHNNLLPYIPLKNVEKVNGVNFPPKYVFNKYKSFCSYEFKSGKMKGEKCKNQAYNLDANNSNNDKCLYCPTHQKLIEKKQETLEKKKAEKEEIVLTPEMEEFAKNKDMAELKEIIVKYNKYPDNYFRERVTGTKKELVKTIFRIKNELIKMKIL
jgi:hypothetical protein